MGRKIQIKALCVKGSFLIKSIFVKKEDREWNAFSILFLSVGMIHCLLDQIGGSKAKNSHIRHNSIQSLALRCQDKRWDLRA